jgi:hypothetical protein
MRVSVVFRLMLAQRKFMRCQLTKTRAENKAEFRCTAEMSASAP